jgi:hypothetical protein
VKTFRFSFGAGLALLAAIALSAGPVAAADPGDVSIATGQLHSTLVLGDIAAADSIAIVFQKSDHSYVRWSTDGGTTFAPRVALNNGYRAAQPRVAACADMVWATSLWGAIGAQRVGVDYRDATTGTGGRFTLGAGYIADIACFGDVVAVTWVVDNDIRLAIIDGTCSNPCVPDYQATIGPFWGSEYGPSIAATDDGFVVTFISTGVTVQHFEVDASGLGLNVTADPPTLMMVGKPNYLPLIAADGGRVVIAYEHSGQTHMRVSEDYGATFAPRIIVSKYCLDCPEGGSAPQSVDARYGLIYVSVLKGGGTPPGFFAGGKVTDDGGQSWTRTEGHSGGTQMGALLSGSVAEAWDSHFYSAKIYGNVPQEIAFHITDL